MNRNKLPNSIEVPSIPTIKTNRFLDKAKKEVSINYKDYYGSSENFNYPLSHKEAEEWLDNFLIERLNLFWDYEDAIHLNNMAKLANIGVKFIPPNPPYYLAPKSIEEINDFIVNRILLSLEVINKLPDNYIYNEND